MRLKYLNVMMRLCTCGCFIAVRSVSGGVVDHGFWAWLPWRVGSACKSGPITSLSRLNHKRRRLDNMSVI